MAEQNYTGRFAWDDKVRRFVWNVFAIIGVIVVLATILTVAGVWTIFHHIG